MNAQFLRIAYFGVMHYASLNVVLARPGAFDRAAFASIARCPGSSQPAAMQHSHSKSRN